MKTGVQERLIRGIWSVLGPGAVALLFLYTTSAQAEFFFGGAAGGNFPFDLDNVQLSTQGLDVPATDIKLDSSFSYGAKIGYFFSPIKWLGLELEGYTSNPNIAEQDIGIAGIPVDLNSADLQVATGAVNLAIRYPLKWFEPYIGVGPAVVYAKVSNRGDSVEAVAPGLNVVAGSRFFLLKWVALYTEYKFNYAEFDFENNDIKLKATYRANHVHAGISIHFK